MLSQLIHFLQQELALSAEEIKLAVRNPDVAPSQLPMILWQYGLQPHQTVRANIRLVGNGFLNNRL